MGYETRYSLHIDAEKVLKEVKGVDANGKPAKIFVEERIDAEKIMDEICSLSGYQYAFSDGCWHANIEIPAPKGCTAKVGSDYKHRTHYEALRCVIERLDGLRTIVSSEHKSLR